jgi:NAD(P)-dependent dehydrogenase (short-subunit alcohol dehydrogenase family)
MPRRSHKRRKRSRRRAGRIDILVTSAGIAGPNAKTWEYPLDDWAASCG